MYNVDWNVLVKNNLPSVLRMPKLSAYVTALLAPVVDLNSRFDFLRGSVATELRITGQVRTLRYWLNFQFDPGADRIRILNAGDAQPFFIFTEEENRPVYLPRFISGRAVDFVVLVPGHLANQEDELRGFLDKYKLPTKRYRIAYI